MWQEIMEPIPEESEGLSPGPGTSGLSVVDFYGHSNSYHDDDDSPTTGRYLHSQPSVLREIYRSEKIESSTRTVPEEKLANVDPRSIDPTTFGPPDMSSTSYAYTYESAFDQPPPPPPPPNDLNGFGNDNGVVYGQDSQQFLNRRAVFHDNVTDTFEDDTDEVDNSDPNIERHTHQIHKVTKLTKVTTTRVVEQVPVQLDHSPTEGPYDQSADPYQVQQPNDHQSVPPEYLSQYAVPSYPGQPCVVSMDVNMVHLAWCRPDFEGDYGPIEGYIVQCRQPNQQSPQNDWQAAHEGLLVFPEVNITGLEPNGEYEFRIIAKNTAGFSEPGTATPLFQLRPKYSSMAPSSAVSPPTGATRNTNGVRNAIPYPPGRPQVVDTDGTSVILQWEPPLETGQGGPVAGYHVEYRPVDPDGQPLSDWTLANDYLVPDNHFSGINVSTNCFGYISHYVKVHGLRPNGDYEFRVVAKNTDGFSDYSTATPPFRVRPLAPPRSVITPSLNNINTSSPLSPGSTAGFPISPNSTNTAQMRGYGSSVPGPPSQPQVTDFDSTCVTLLWAPPQSPRSGPGRVLGYHIQGREIGSHEWFDIADRLITGNQYVVSDLKPNSTFEFRVFSKNIEGWSEPSEVSEIVQLRPKTQHMIGNRSVPSKPYPPEVMEVGADTVSLCWPPTHSSLPIQGYQLELRDSFADPSWQPVNQILTSQCKISVSNLSPGHQYEFRVIAKNAIGYSQPSEPSQSAAPGGQPRMPDSDSKLIPSMISLQSLSSGNPLAVRRHGSVNSESLPLPDELRTAKESPPITDTDDSPPPLRRHPPYFTGASNDDGVEWRDPTLPEVIDYLNHLNDGIKTNATGYLQHLTYNDNTVKQKTRELGAIPKLVTMLNTDNKDLLRNVCGCLRNLSYGRENDENKHCIAKAGGIPSLANVLHKVTDHQVLEELTGILWNLSSVDEMKPTVLNNVVTPLVQNVVIPYSCWNSKLNPLTTDITKQQIDSRKTDSIIFRNSAGVLRNVSSAGEPARRVLREKLGLVDSLIYFLRYSTLIRKDFEGTAVKNVMCCLRNLSYRCQEMSDPDFDKRPMGERSKSAPSGSPKGKPKTPKSKKKLNKDSNTEVTDPNAWYMQRPAKGASLLWQPEVTVIYLKMLDESSNADILEAVAGTIQNLAGCYWQPSIEIRAVVRKEKGLPSFVELLRIDVDLVVCAVAKALRNLALDARNRDLIGKFAMRDLIRKLPVPPQAGDPPQLRFQNDVGEDTLAAVLGVLYETISCNIEYARLCYEKGGIEKLVYITRARHQFSPRVVKYASQVLFHLWQHRELHELYRRGGFKETDFVTRTMAARANNNMHGGTMTSPSTPHGTDTLSRPISNQGANRNEQQQHQHQSAKSKGIPQQHQAQSHSRVRPDIQRDNLESPRSRLGSTTGGMPNEEQQRMHGLRLNGGNGMDDGYKLRFQNDVGEDTLAAVLGVLYETISCNIEYARLCYEKGITRARHQFSPRVVKYASQVLFHLWQHRELHKLYRRGGFKETDFVTRTVAARANNNMHGGTMTSPSTPHGTDTLSRPISNQGANRNEQQQHKHQSAKSKGIPQQHQAQSHSRVCPDIQRDNLESPRSRLGSTTGGMPNEEQQRMHGLRLNGGNGVDDGYKHSNEPLYSTVQKPPRHPHLSESTVVYNNGSNAAINDSHLYSDVTNGHSITNYPAGDSWV